MWTFRRASIHLKNRGLSSGPSLTFSVKSEIATQKLRNCPAGSSEPQEKLFENSLTTTRYYSASSSSRSCTEIRSFSSQAGPNDSEDDDALEDDFSDLEAPDDSIQEAASREEENGESNSESELPEDESGVDDIQNDLETLQSEYVAQEKRSSKSTASSVMTKMILTAPASPVYRILDKWVEEGNQVYPTDATVCMLELRKRRLFVKALQLSEWLESKKCFDFLEGNYAARVDLIAKVRGLYNAVSYMQSIPEPFRGELVYRTLLASCVSAVNLKKSEEVFNKMRDLGLSISCFACNQMLLLYKKTDKKKIADILLLMEKENIKPSDFTYQVLINVKGLSKDISGMEKIFQSMKDEGLKPSTQLLASFAQHCVAAGFKDKAETILKDIEGDNIKETPWACRFVLPIYASLGREDEVERIWKVCESNPRLDECMAAIDAWGKLKKIENAEAAFEKLVKKVKNPYSKHYSALLKVYADNKMLEKGKDLVKRIGETGCIVGPVIWDALVKLCVGAGEVEKADAILEKLVKKKAKRPLFTSFSTIMDEYAKRGDIHNTEKLFLQIKKIGYTPNLQQYQSLLQAYLNAKTPAYGFSERMKADNFIPNKSLLRQLGRVNAFSKTTVAEALLE